MSGLIVGLVLRIPITETFNTEAKFIATVYADHAWEDGTHAHPAVETVSKITGLHVRTVQRYMHNVLKPMGMLIEDGKGPRGTIQYRFPLETGEEGSVRLKLKGGALPPRQAAGGDRESGDTESGGAIVSPKQTIRPLIHEEEEKAAQVFSFSQELQAELKDLGVFVSTWQHVEKQIASGWTETDVVALLDWMSKTRRDKPKAAQGFVTRVREGTKAPSEYYDFPGRKLTGRWYPGRSTAEVTVPAPAYEEPEPEYFFLGADETITAQIERAWQSVLDQLRMDMGRGTFDSYVRDTQPVHFENDVLHIAVPSEYARDWLESRLASSSQRLLVGILNKSVSVKFVVACSVSAETESG